MRCACRPVDVGEGNREEASKGAEAEVGNPRPKPAGSDLSTRPLVGERLGGESHIRLSPSSMKGWAGMTGAESVMGDVS